jgi:pimeloyl-ACP methyl ester carboxylesterase
VNVKEKLAITYIRARLNILALVSPASAAKKAMDLFCTPFKRSGKKLPPLFDKGEKLSFRLDGSTIRGHRWLPHQASSTTLKKVLIAHGFESSSRNFEQYIHGFLKKGYEVLAFDAPAHGQSGGRRITLPAYIRTLGTVLFQFGPVDAFMGHSFGGLALTMLLESLPQNPNTRIVLIAPACEALRAVDSFFELLHLNPAIRPAFDDIGLKMTDQPFSWFSIRRAMHRLRSPVLWLQDEDDKITPLADAMLVKEDGHPNIQFIVTKGLGHRKIYRDEEVIRQVLAFL